MYSLQFIFDSCAHALSTQYVSAAYMQYKLCGRLSFLLIYLSVKRIQQQRETNFQTVSIDSTTIRIQIDCNLTFITQPTTNKQYKYLILHFCFTSFPVVFNLVHSMVNKNVPFAFKYYTFPTNVLSFCSRFLQYPVNLALLVYFLCYWSLLFLGSPLLSSSFTSILLRRSVFPSQPVTSLHSSSPVIDLPLPLCDTIHLLTFQLSCFPSLPIRLFLFSWYSLRKKKLTLGGAAFREKKYLKRLNQDRSSRKIKMNTALCVQKQCLAGK